MAVYCRIRLFILREIIHLLLLPEERYIAKNWCQLFGQRYADKKDARGYAEDGKAVFDAAFAAVDQVVKDGMGEEEKVKAIHDYLIYHANYVNNGDYSTAENWAYGAGGVLLHKEGVCQSYAFAFI